MNTKRRLSVVLAAAAFVLLGSTSAVSAAPSASPPEVVGLKTDAQASPLGIDDPKPRLSWQLDSARRGVMQTAYEVRVSRNGDTVWDSGRTQSADPWADYAGPALLSRTRYTWTVRIWDELGEVSDFAEPRWFETAFLNASEWSADWIRGTLTGCTTRDQCPAPLLRTEFDVDKPVASARLYASGLGYGVYEVNGQRAGDARLDPGFTDYMDRVFYVTHDVTDFVHRGRNALGVELGRGWYGIALGQGATNGYAKSSSWHAEPELRLELHLTFADGSTAVVRSNPTSWKTTDGPTRFDDLMQGETYDARRAAALDGWSEPGFNDSGWAAAVAASAPRGTLVAMDQEPIRATDRLAPRSVIKRADGSYVFDFGEDIAGTASVDAVTLNAGQQISLRYGEQLNASGAVVAINNGQLDKYTAAGGPAKWSAQFSYKGFRYVQLSGLTEPPPHTLLTAEVLRSAMPRVGSWSSDNELVNTIFANSVRAYVSNSLSVPTDCPHFEKGAYTADGQLTAPAFSYVFDTQRFYSKWSEDVADSVFPTGQMDWIAPAPSDPSTSKTNNVHLLTPGWDAALFEVPDTVYRFYGDPRPAVQALPEMKTYNDWILKFGPAGVIPEVGATFLSQTGLGDWTAPTNAPTNQSLDSTAWYREMMRVLEWTARRAGDTATADAAQTRVGLIDTAFNARFWNPATSSYENIPGSSQAQDGTQHANAMAVGLGLSPADRIQAAGDAAAASVKAHNNHLFTGIMGTRFLFPTLSQTGHTDEAWAALTQTTYPSYGYWISLGWTALGEYWEASARSRNHQMYGSVVQWLYEDLAGMKSVKPGFAEIEFNPQIPSSGVTHVEASTDTVRGEAASAWRKTGAGGLQLDVTVPPTATGVVRIPAADASLVDETGGGEGVQLVGKSGGRVVYRVGSGHYRFIVHGAQA